MHQSPTRNQKISQAYGKMRPSTAATLIRKIEGKRARGYDDPTFDLILPFARSILQSSGRKAAREATILRLFCVPFEDALVNHALPLIQPGRINRQSITPVWNWLGAKLMPGKITELSIMINRAVEAEDLPALRAVCSVLYRESAKAMQKAFARSQRKEKSRKRLSVRLGHMSGVANAMEMLCALRQAGAIGEMRDRLPAMVSRLEGQKLEAMTALMLEYFERLPDERGIVAASFLSRLENPSQILLVPVNVLGSANAGPIASSRFGVLGDILLFDIDCAVDEAVSLLRHDIPAGEILAKLDDFHGRISSFTEVIDIPPQSPWGQRLAKSRTRISDLLEREIRPVPDLMREYIKHHDNRQVEASLPQSVSSARVGPAPVYLEEKLVRALGLMKGCKPCLDQLSINNTMRKVENQMRQVSDFARIVGKSKLLVDLENRIDEDILGSTGR